MDTMCVKELLSTLKALVEANEKISNKLDAISAKLDNLRVVTSPAEQ